MRDAIAKRLIDARERYHRTVAAANAAIAHAEKMWRLQLNEAEVVPYD